MYKHIKKRAHVEWDAGLEPLWGQWLDRFASWGVVTFVVALLRGGISMPKVPIMAWLFTILGIVRTTNVVKWRNKHVPFMFFTLVSVSIGNIHAQTINDYLFFETPLPGSVRIQGFKNYLCKTTDDQNKCTNWYGYHSGVDMGYGGNPSGKSVFAIGLGTVESFLDTTPNPKFKNSGKNKTHTSPLNYITLKHVTTTGKTWYSHHEHLAYDSIPALSEAQDARVLKGNIIGEMGSTGSLTSGRHLHFEIRNKNRYSAGYYPSKTAVDNAGLISPDSFVNGDYGVPLIPYFSPFITSPRITNYEVFGVTEQTLYTSITLTTTSKTTFNHIGVGGRLYSNDNNVQDVFIADSETLIANQATTLDGRKPLSEENNYLAEGDYKFFAYSDEFGGGYPLKVSIIPHENSKIVDNDSREGFSKGNVEEIQDVPGYYVSAHLSPGQVKNWAKWEPELESGIYEVWVHIPTGTSAETVRYKVYPNGNKNSDEQPIAPILSNAINHGTNRDSWVQLTVGSGDNQVTSWSFTQNGYVGLSISKSDDTNAGDGDNKDILENQLVGIDAVKFLYSDANDDSVNDNDTSDTSNDGTVNDGNNVDAVDNDTSDTSNDGTVDDGNNVDAVDNDTSGTSNDSTVVDNNDTNTDNANTGICSRSADPDNNYLNYQEGSAKVNTSELRDGNASHNLAPAEIVYYSAKENEVNPVLLLAKLQDEQSLLTQGENFGDFENRLKLATGYGISDSNPSDEWLGFYPQLVGSAYQWNTFNESGKTFEKAYASYTSGEGKYTGFIQEGGIYAVAAERMNAVASTSYAVQPESTGYYNDFKNITVTHIQIFLDLDAYSGGALSNQNLFSEEPIQDSQVAYACDDSNITPVDEINEPPPSITLKMDENGNIQISGSSLEDNGTITVDGKEIKGEWITDGIDLNTGIMLENLDKPVRIIGTDGSNEIFNICYPFIDVCPDTWYAKPIITLWKKGIVNGYGGDWEGYFRPHKPPANRAEFVTATVRALEPNVQPMSIANSSFTDIKGDEWYAVYVQYAKDMGIVNGCGTNKFCPTDSITRSAGVKVVVEAFLKGALTRFKLGQQPESTFKDVTDSSKWYYPYIYAAQAEKVISGYSDGYFKPEQKMNRAEMAKVICLAAFGGMECSEMGNTDRPAVFTVMPDTAILDEPIMFTVEGINLPETTAFWIGECENVMPITGGTTEKRQFECTPSHTAGIKEGVVKDKSGGTELVKFTVNVQEPVAVMPIIVTSVSPTTATLNQLMTFTVNGSNLPDSTAFWIGECEGVTQLSGGTPEQRQFQCTPSWSTGIKEAVVKDESGGTALLDFTVTVQETVSTTCTNPSVTSVSPLTVTLDQSQVFTVNGSCLPDSTAFWIAECEGVTQLSGGTPEQRQFQCTPSWTTGVKEAVVKDESGGTALLDFTVTVQETVSTACTNPSVTSVSPLTVTLDQSQVFTVNGSCLPDSTAFWIGECEDVTQFGGGTPEQQQFQCTPSWTTGVKDAVVKDESGGTELFNFVVNVQQATGNDTSTDDSPTNDTQVVPPSDISCTPTVDSVKPTTVTISDSVTFTAEGKCLPDTTAFWIGECENMTALGGSDTEQKFRCTPSWTVGSKKAHIKDKKDGIFLKPEFTVEVEWGTPVVTSVTPSSASLDSQTDFVVKGRSLTNDIAFWIGECENVEVVNRNAEEQIFQCTPSWTTGYKDGVVKDQPGGTELYPFTLEVLD